MPEETVKGKASGYVNKFPYKLHPFDPLKGLRKQIVNKNP